MLYDEGLYKIIFNLFLCDICTFIIIFDVCILLYCSTVEGRARDALQRQTHKSHCNQHTRDVIVLSKYMAHCMQCRDTVRIMVRGGVGGGEGGGGANKGCSRYRQGNNQLRAWGPAGCGAELRKAAAHYLIV